MQIELQTLENGKRIAFSGSLEIVSTINELKNGNRYREIVLLAQTLPSVPQTIMLKVNAYLQLKQWNRVIDCCNQGILLDPNESEFYNLKGKALGKIGKNEQKIKMVYKAIKLNDEVPAYHRNLGAAYYNLEKFPQAIVYHTKAIELEPANSINYHNRGSSFFRNLQYKEAYLDFTAAVSKNPNLGLTYGWVGECAEKMGDIFDSYQNFSKAYELTQNPLHLQNKIRLQKEIKKLGKQSNKQTKKLK